MHSEHCLQRLHAGRWPIFFARHGGPVVAFERRKVLVAPRAAAGPSLEQIKVERAFELAYLASPRVIGMLVEKVLHPAANVAQVALLVVGDGHDPLIRLIGSGRLHEEPCHAAKCGHDHNSRKPLPHELPQLLASLLLGGDTLDFRDGDELIPRTAIDLRRRRGHVGGQAGRGAWGCRRGSPRHDAPAGEVLRDVGAARCGPLTSAARLTQRRFGRRCLSGWHSPWPRRLSDRVRECLGGSQKIDVVAHLAPHRRFARHADWACCGDAIHRTRWLVAPLVGRWIRSGVAGWQNRGSGPGHASGMRG